MAEGVGRRLLLAVIAGALALLAAIVGDDTRAVELRMEPLALARLLRDGEPGLLLLDVRSPDAFAEYALPRARHFQLDDSSTAGWPGDATIVVYAEIDARARRVARQLRLRGAWDAYALEGGVRAWIEQLESPRLPPLRATASPADSAARREHLELSRYFGGLPVVDPALSPAAPRSRGEVPVRSATAADSSQAAVSALRRRGC